jgi:D-alanine-D-alanine ligase-like ATP-grasp enzyme
MKDLINISLTSMRPSIEMEYTKGCGRLNPALSKKYFHIMGYDIMFDEKYQPWLFEINSNPSMNIMCEKDTATGEVKREKSEVDE